MAEFAFTELPGDERELTLDGRVVAHFGVGNGIDPVDTPKPFIHPLVTAGGVEVTGFAPDDHPWHHGLMFAFPRVDGSNLWGGGTYVDQEVWYQHHDDQGRLDHLAWAENRTDGSGAFTAESVRWVGNDGAPLLDENRSWAFGVREIDGVTAIAIDFDTSLRSATGADVALATPAQRGRPDGGYGGLFLRLGEGFTLTAIFGDRDDIDLTESGGESRTMIVHGATAGGQNVTLGLAFGDEPTVGHRRWLHRFEPFAAIGWAHAYIDALTVPAGDELRFRHRLVIADGHLDPASVRAAL